VAALLIERGGCALGARNAAGKDALQVKNTLKDTRQAPRCVLLMGDPCC